MMQVGELPDLAHGDAEEKEDNDGEYNLEEEEEHGSKDQAEVQGAVAAEAFDEDAFQQRMVERLETLRLDQALGNDEDGLYAPLATEEADGDSDSESSASFYLKASTYYKIYTRDRYPNRPHRMSTKHLELQQEVKETVSRERQRSKGNGALNKSAGPGKVKGHKWKTNDRYLVGKNSGW